MPRGVPKNGKRKRRVRRIAKKLEGVSYFGSDARLILTADKSLGKLRVVDLGDRWAIVAL